MPQKAVGKSGYVLWNWRQQLADPALQSDGIATPTKVLSSAFKDTIAKDSFRAAATQGVNPWGGYSAFQVNGQDDKLLQNRALHGSVPLGMSGQDEITLQPTDDAEHLYTLVVSAIGVDNCLVRVTARNADGGETVVRFLNTDKADHILQFKAKGTVTLKLQITSQPPRQFNDIVGPSALFLD